MKQSDADKNAKGAQKLARSYVHAAQLARRAIGLMLFVALIIYFIVRCAAG